MEIILGILNNIPDAISLGVLWSIMTLGVFITFKILDIPDMTVDGSFALGGCTTAAAMAAGINPILCILISVFVGFCAGAVTGILHTKLKIPAILAGILTMLSLYSINLKILQGKANLAMPKVGADKVSTVMDYVQNITGLSTRYSTMLFGIILLIGIICFLYWFFGTEIGCSIRATGNNEAMIRALGVNTDRMKIIGIVLANGLVALSGSIVSQSQRYSDVGMGTGTIVIGLASIIIGEVIFSKSKGFFMKLISLAAGSVIYRIVIAIVLRLGMNPNDLKLLTAVIVTIALSFPVLRAKTIEQKRRKMNIKKHGEGM